MYYHPAVPHTGKQRKSLLALTLALVVTVVVDQASSIAHAATHSTGGIEHCDLCLGYSLQSHGVPPSVELASDSASHVEVARFVPVHAASRPTVPCRQRGPPLIG